MKQIFPNPSNGIFNYINIENTGLTNKNYLNILYHTNNSEKSISPLLESFVTDHTITVDNLTTIGHLIEQMYTEKWKGLYKTITLSYNPIENYNLTESENTQTDFTNNKTNNSTTQNKNNASQTDTSTVQNTSNVDMQTYGFNSSTAVDKDKNSSTDDTTNNYTSSSENTMNMTNQNTSSENVNNNTKRTLNRSGNIGVTTNQTMIKQERALWDWNYYNTVFKDIDNLLTLSIYE